MNDIYVINKEYTVKRTIEKMESNNIKAVVVVEEDVVIGLFSNGDMRSFFLRGGKLSDNITAAMNCNPILYKSIDAVEFDRKRIPRVIYPIVDEYNKLIDIIDDKASYNNTSEVLANVPVVIMAGGKGTRLYPYTKVLPKPLIPIGDYTITERIIQQFRNYGCSNYFMILNHKKNMIKAYMNDLEKDYEINYIDENQFLGTAGGLKYLKGSIDNTFFLSNCDILIDADFECIYKTHKKNGNKITFVCSMKNIVIPYGVVKTDEIGNIKCINEKPEFSYLVNTGLYIVEPEVLDEIEDNEYIHMPDLAQRYIDRGEKVGVFPVSEKSWLDMGQFSEMENMVKQIEINNEIKR